MQLIRRILTIIVVILFTSQSVFAVQPDSKGTEFWLMFNGNLNGSGENVDLFIAGDIPTTGLVEIPGLGFSQVFNVIPGVVTTVDLPLSVRLNSSDIIENKGVHITADNEVTVYGLNQRDSTTDAFLGLPVDILGTEYINLGYENVNVVNGTQFGVVATTDNTTVTITPTESTSGHPAGVDYNIILNQGQAYQLRNTSSSPADLSGSIITSDNPVAVFGGHQCANIPAGYVACDHIVEQIPPVNTWGQSFVTFPLATRTSGDTFRILASDDLTTVNINGINVALLNRGELFETILVNASTINADKPVLVAQYSNSTSIDNVTSDPLEAIVPPLEQYLAGYTVSTPATQISINYINLVVPDAAIGSVTLDGVVIPGGDYTPIGLTGFSGTAQKIDLGSHTLAGPLPFGVLSYGFDSYDSYGYPGGLALAKVAELTDLDLTPATATNPINTEHCVVATTVDQNADPLPGIRVDFDVSGANPIIGFVFTNATGDAQFCYTGTNDGSDTITASVGNLNATATKTWTDISVVYCDVDVNGQIDRLDIRAIMARRNLPATGPEDPADADGNGIINANDARQCVLMCTNNRCAE
jgi:hypothetical protein